ncbi:helix-turn-helix domain-containing protein [Escherichia coli]|uniref:helix-turn-helix domain-containing protein n=1 Tax=Escherichia coli TaxID=562 RepID=UPI0015D4EDED|nr:helix-turn-helix domain-containing protein [Escherichia coli]NYW24390.1 hypothetical protein [Escherichia coli]
MDRKLAQVDLETGEILDGFVAYIGRKKINGFARWFAMSQDAIATLKGIKSVEEFRVLMALLERLDYENMILLPQADIAKDLGMHVSNVSRAIRKLESYGVVERGPKIGNIRSFRLNPTFCWKGSSTKHVQELNDSKVPRGRRKVKEEEEYA